ncbi:MAG TPA: hypothetical protein VNF50_00440 [Acidimicrobiales bacterium]|nr:hypothetical protein [Acidimicrobiales bacterium]
MADSTRDKLRAVRAHGSPASRRPGEVSAVEGTPLPVEKKVRTTLDLPSSLHRALRVRCAEEGIDAQTFLRGLLEKALAG